MLKASAAWLLLTIVCALPAAESSRLRETFFNPPEEAKPRGYWIWPHGNFDYATMRRELADFKAKGLGGVDIFDLGVKDSKNVIPPGPGFMSREQVDGIAFALAEAKRLNLKMGLIVSSSWNAGGTWTPPELAMMNLVAWRETNTGPMRYERALPFPEIPATFRKPYGTFQLFVPKDENGLPLYRKEIALLAYPLNADGTVADPQQVRDLSGQLDASGRLTWEMPAGRWVILRAVLVNFGQRLWLPSDNSQGLTMDHFSKAATRHHFGTIIDRLQARVGPLQNTALERLYLASYEANAGVIWTPDFAPEFHRQNGYRIEPFLPALYGAVVVDQDTTDRFSYDYRKTVSELFLNNCYREASRICRAHGLLLCSEAGGPGTPLHDVPTEELKSLGSVDVMRGEFWNGKTNQLTPDGFEELQIVKSIASAAHIYGHKIVEMESFTSHINWQEGMDIFKPLADRAFCEGMTRVVYHTMAHNLPAAGRPGWTYQAGTHIGTTATWWEFTPALNTYLARCSALLMQGHFAADVAYYYGDDVPLFAKPKHLRPDLGHGYDYDDLNTEVLLRARVNARGEIVLPGGMRYAVLVLPPQEKCMDLAALQKIEQLVKGGATVIGPKPERIYGLRGMPQAEQQLRQIAGRLWDTDSKSRRRVVTGLSTRAALEQKGLGPDFEVHPADLRGQIDFIHRRTEREEIYFLRNAGDQPARFEAQFRVHARQPELWNPLTGEMRPSAIYRATSTGTILPLHLPANGSLFVIFSSSPSRADHIVSVQHQGQSIFPGGEAGQPSIEVVRNAKEQIRFSAAMPGEYKLHFAGGRSQTITVAAAEPIGISGPWEVRFPHGWEVPTQQMFDTLISWTDSTNAATRAFSGTAVYARNFEIEAGQLPVNHQVWLNLGEVREVARVFLNGQEVGTSFIAPHQFDVTSKLRAGENLLVIEVANTWINRLAADDALPEAQRKTQTNLTGPVGGKRWRDTPPKPSGLLGPVRLEFAPQVLVKTKSSPR